MNRARALRVSFLLLPVLAVLLALLVAGSGAADPGTSATPVPAGTGAAIGIAPPTTAGPATGSGTGGETGATAGTGVLSGSTTTAGRSSTTRGGSGGTGTALGGQTVYVAEHDTDSAGAQQGSISYHGFAAFIDGATDTLITRSAAGSFLSEVAVSPDGSRVYMTDSDEPVLHVFDAVSRRQVVEITLPGVTIPNETIQRDAIQDPGMQIPYSDWAACASGVASTPDGALVLVCSNAGLQVVDTASEQVVRTLSDLPGGNVAVSFDGKRAYVSSSDYSDLAPRTFGEWVGVAAETRERLVCLDLETWEIVKEIAADAVGSIAVKPDDSEVFFSECYKHQVRVVDALTLEDLWTVSTDPSYALGLGFVPNGTKAYVVCSADVDALAYWTGQSTVRRVPTAEEYFCGVIDTTNKEIIKRIPLEAY